LLSSGFIVLLLFRLGLLYWFRLGFTLGGIGVGHRFIFYLIERLGSALCAKYPSIKDHEE
jgi:hypothetical protein